MPNKTQRYPQSQVNAHANFKMIQYNKKNAIHRGVASVLISNFKMERLASGPSLGWQAVAAQRSAGADQGQLYYSRHH